MANMVETFRVRAHSDSQLDAIGHRHMDKT